ncbi:MAG: nickel pincer cofactor biosynthesis protein LarC [Chloroflexota bacterium]
MPKTIKQIMIVDAQVAGVSGDMFVGALLDLGANPARVTEAMKIPQSFLRGCKNLEIKVGDTTRRRIRAKRVEVNAEEEGHERHGTELIEAAISTLSKLKISEKAGEFVLSALNTLINAEAKIHGNSTDEVHLHEAGSVDTLADIIGTAVALEDLGVFTQTKVYSTPVAVGGGLLKFSHGMVSSPAPATIEILRSKGAPIVGGPVEFELATPTGASILANLADEFVRFYPPMKPAKIGYGCGSKDFPVMPNVLRLVLGEPLTTGLVNDQIYVIETNLDDTTGEIIGHTMDKLFQAGARDVCIIPMFTKKNRPGQIIKVMADRASVEDLSRVLVDETGTLGVRIYPCERRILARESTSIEVEVGDIKERVDIKIARDANGEIIQVKPEYDQVKNLAGKTKRPLREIMEIVRKRVGEGLV